MEQRLTLITIGVDNLERMARFYQNVFGWEASGSSNDNIVFYQLNGIQLTLYGRKELAADAGISSEGEGTGFNRVALAHNLRSEREVDELFKEFMSREVNILKSPHKTFWGGYSGYIADPEDNLWEIAYNPFMKLDASGNVAGH